MATEVSRSLAEIDAQIRTINSSLKACAKETSSLSKSLKLDPTNLDLAGKKAESLKNQIALATEKVKLLRERQAAMVSSDPTASTTEAYRKLSVQISQAESEVKVLNKELQKTNSTKLSNLQTGLSGISRACTAILASVVAIGAAFAATGDAIDEASERFNISAATYQYWQHIFSKTTGNDNGYVNVLNSVTSLLGQVEKGSSKAATALGLIGLTLEDLSGLGSHEAMLLIIEQLQQIEDIDERTAAAYALLGPSGQDLAMVSELTASEIASLNAELEKAGLITDEQAKKAGKLNDAFDNLKNTAKQAVVDMGESLVPCLMALMNIATAFLPILTAVANVLNFIGPAGQIILFILLAVVAILPKVAALIQAVQVVTTTLNITLGALVAKLLIVAGIVVAIGALLSAIFGSTYSLDVDTSSVDGLLDSTNVALTTDYNKSNGNGTTNNVTYNDYSSTNVEVKSEVDLDEVIDGLNSKVIQVGGK